MVPLPQRNVGGGCGGAGCVLKGLSGVFLVCLASREPATRRSDASRYEMEILATLNV